MKRLAILLPVIAFLMAPGIAFAYLRLHGHAKVAVVVDSYLTVPGGGGGVAPPSRSAVYGCFSAWRSTADRHWAISTFNVARANQRECRRWASNGYAITHLNRNGVWITDVEGDYFGPSCRIRGRSGQPSVPLAVAHDFFGRRCRGVPH